MLKIKFSLLSSRSRISELTLLILCALIVIFETPILSRNISNIVCYGLIGLFFLSAINVFLNLDAFKKNVVYSIMLYLLYISVMKVFRISSAALSYYSVIVKFLFMCIAMIAIFDSLTKRQKVFLLLFTLGVILIVIFDNIRLYQRYGAFRYVYLFQSERFTTNSVNTVFVSALLFVAGAMFLCFLHTGNWIQKAVALALTALILVFSVVIAQRTIVLILSIAMFPLIALANSKRKKTFAVVIMAAVVIVPVIDLYYQSILQWIADISNSVRIQRRISQLISISSYEDFMQSGGSGAARIKLIQTSLRTFISSPLTFLFGAGDHRSTTDIIGNHSQFIDEFARYGVLGGAIMVNMIRMLFKALLRSLKLDKGTPLYNQVRVLLLFVVLRGMLGTIFEPPVSIAIFICLAAVCNVIRGREADENMTGGLG